MGRPLRIEFEGACYHITSRGNEQKDIFKSKRDWEKFLGYLESAAFRYGAILHAWCLMTNHYHLLLETPRGNLSQVMRHINGAYTNYFNAKRKRSGHLFQGRYKAILIEADPYLVELSRYIHLNPVRAKIVAKPEDYPWSSYGAYVDLQARVKWHKTEYILEQFAGRSDRYRQFVEDFLDKGYESPLTQTVAATVLGSETFVRHFTETHVAQKHAGRDMPAVRHLIKPLQLEKILNMVRETMTDEKTARKASIYLAHRYSGARLKELGVYFGLSESGVSQLSRRFETWMDEKEVVKKEIEGIIENLGLSRV
jgi:REP element-mobilizing transposase RayT